MEGSAPGILLKPTPPLGSGHKAILARGWPKAIRLCLEWKERKNPNGLFLLLKCVRCSAHGSVD